MKIVLLLDSGCDIPKSFLDTYRNFLGNNKVDYLYAGVSLGEVDYKSDPSWGFTPIDNYFNCFTQDIPIRLFQPSLFEWKIVFEKYLEEGYNIIYLSISKRYAGGFKQATIIKNILEKPYPNQYIEIIDSMKTSSALKLIALRIIEDLCDNQIKDLSSYVSFVKDNYIKDNKTFWICDTLKYVKNSGRSSESDNFFGVDSFDTKKPLVETTDDGLFKVTSCNTTRMDSLKDFLRKNNTIKGFEFTYSPDMSSEEIQSIVCTIESHYDCKLLHNSSIMSPTNVAVAGPCSYSIGVLY